MTATVQTRTLPATTPSSSRSGVSVGVDGSPCGEIAALWAADEARRLGVPLTIVHAAQPSDRVRHGPSGSRVVLARTAANVNAHHPELSVTTELSHLSPADVLEAVSRGSSLIVTGARGRGGTARMLTGSVTRTLVAHAHCPLVVVPSAPMRDVTDDVVLGIGTGESEATIQYAFEAARRLRARLTVVRACTSPTPTTAEIEGAIAPLRVEWPDVPTRTVVRQGDAASVLLAAARRSRLLVVGARRQRGPLAVGAGYVVDGLIAHSQVPVAVVPQP